MRILQLSHKGLTPPDGGTLAVSSLTDSYAKLGHQVTLVCLETHKHKVNKLFQGNHQKNITLNGIPINTRTNYIKAFFNLLFSKQSYIVSRFFNHRIKNTIRHILKDDFDVIQFEGIYMAVYLDTIKNHSNALISIRTHNIEYQIWESQAKKCYFLKKIYLKIQAKRLKKFELQYLPKFDVVLPISESDEKILETIIPKEKMLLAPFGINVGHSASNMEIASKDLFYIGALDWLPNIDALKWFIKNVWSRIHKNYPELKFYIAGRNASRKTIKIFSHPGIYYMGEVDNAHQFMKEHQIMVVPLFTGSGIRVKIIEGMSLGKTIIASSAAIRGIDAQNNKEFLLADSYEEFYHKIKDLLGNKDLCHKLAVNARKLIQEKYDNRTISDNIIQHYKNRLNDR